MVCPMFSAKIEVRYPRSAKTTPQVSPDTPAPMMAIFCCIPNGRDGSPSRPLFFWCDAARPAVAHYQSTCVRSRARSAKLTGTMVWIKQEALTQKVLAGARISREEALELRSEEHTSELQSR